MTSRFRAYSADANTTFDHTFWNRVMQEIDARILGIEEKKADFEDAERQLIEVALRRINQTIQPAAEKIQALSTLGFLTASSDDSAKPEVDQQLTIVLREGEQRDLFTPSPFLALTRRSTVADYAVARLISYVKETGQLLVEVLAVYGDPGPHSDWDVAALAGSVLAGIQALEETRSLRDAVSEDKEATTTARGEAVGAAADAVEAAGLAIEAAETAADAAEAAAAFDPSNYVAALESATDGAVVGFDGETGKAIKELSPSDVRTYAGLGSAAEKDEEDFAASSTEVSAGDGLTGGGDLSEDRTLSIDKASNSDIRGGTSNKVLTADAVWSAAQGVNLGNISGTVNMDFNNFLGLAYGTVTGNLTLGTVSNAKPGKTVVFDLAQDATGNRTLSVNSSYWLVADGNVPAWATTANARNVLVATVLRDGKVLLSLAGKAVS